MGNIIYTCPFVPAEWIAAHGLHPGRFLPEAKGSNNSITHLEGVCSYVRAFVNDAMASQEAIAVIVTTACDQMRRAYEILIRKCDLPVFLLNVPGTWQHKGAQRLYLDELKRLGDFLVKLGGTSPSNDTLTGIMTGYDKTRTSLLNAREHLTSRQFSEAIAAFNRGDKKTISTDPANGKVLFTGIPLAIVGGPLFRGDLDLFDTIERSGGQIMLDASVTGELGMCRRFDPDKLRSDPLKELADAYLCGIPDASRRPNTGLYSWLENKLAERKIRGIIFRRCIWCDIWHAELCRLKQWTSLPVLDMDVNGQEAVSPRMMQRMLAFLEMLQ